MQQHLYSLDEIAYLAEEMGNRKWEVLDKLDLGLKATTLISQSERIRCKDVVGLWAIQRKRIGPDIQRFLEALLEESFITESLPDRYTLNQLCLYQMSLLTVPRVREKLEQQGEPPEIIERVCQALQNTGSNIGKWWSAIPSECKPATGKMLRAELT